MKKIIIIFSLVFSVFGLNLFAQERDHAFEMNSRLGMGVNLGNLFDAPSLGEWGIEPDSAYFTDIKSKGFASVRLPVRWSVHAEETFPYTIDREFMDTIKWAVDLALKNELPIVINIHHYEEMMSNPAVHKERFLALWDQISTQFQHYTDSLYFEIFNEPNGSFTPAIWNEYLVEGLLKIREKNPTRMVIIGTAEWGGIGGLSQLQLPDDPNIILTIHYYEPFNFTHQGADWAGNWPTGVTWDSTAAQINAIKRDMDVIKQYSEQHDVPVYIGEFGAIANADDASRARWIGHLHHVFEEYGFSGAYWEYCSGFGIYDPVLNCYRTGMLHALTGFEGEVCDCSVYDTVIVKNSTFDKSIQPWFFNLYRVDGATAEIAAVNGEARIEIISNGTEGWHIQFLYSSFPLIQGNTYTLIFDAYASSPVTIVTMINRDGGDYHAADYHNTDLTTEKTTFSYTFTYEEATMDKARIAFDCGLAHTQYIYFDNIHLYEKTPASLIVDHTTLSKCMIKAGKNIFAVEGNSIETITIYDVSGRICYWKTYPRVDFVEVEDACLPSGISFIQVRTDVGNMVVKNIKKK